MMVRSIEVVVPKEFFCHHYFYTKTLTFHCQSFLFLRTVLADLQVI